MNIKVTFKTIGAYNDVGIPPVVVLCDTNHTGYGDIRAHIRNCLIGWTHPEVWRMGQLPEHHPEYRRHALSGQVASTSDEVFVEFWGDRTDDEPPVINWSERELLSRELWALTEDDETVAYWLAQYELGLVSREQVLMGFPCDTENKTRARTET